MITRATAATLMREIKNFERAMDGPSTDAEVDAACAMRDAALEVLREAVAQAAYIEPMLQKYDNGR